MEGAARHRCPICGRDAPPRHSRNDEPGNAAVPFCSPACKLVDLGRWLDGGYRVPGPSVESSVDADRIALERERDDE
jgi:endogenous inhibitor of DNA gyrase (YacG/DUF329 family)